MALRPTFVLRALIGVLLAGSAAGCGSSSATTAPVERLDSIAVLGHSGTTGYNSNPHEPNVDAPENSWATGSNRAVDSIYRRLLASHPALKGHAFHYGIDGSDVTSLPGQVRDMLKAEPLPDVVVIQSIDNDIACDGTDDANYAPYGRRLEAVLSSIFAKDPTAQVYLVDQWSAVKTYAAALVADPNLVQANAGTGPCDLFTFLGKPRPAAAVYLQHVVDSYFAQITTACARHPRCYTDRGTMQTMPLSVSDLTPDGNHLSISGQTAMAAVAWSAMPDAIKNRR